MFVLSAEKRNADSKVRRLRREGIIPAVESSHALAYALKRLPSMRKDQILLVNLSGRGDKDLETVLPMLGL